MNPISVSNIIYLIINIIIILYNISSILKFTFIKQPINVNFSKLLIKDILINETCPKEYENLTLGIYNGINKGCYCNNSNMFYIRECYFNESNCMNIKKIKPMKIGNYEGKQFCLKKGNSYLDYLKNNYLSIGNCSNNYYNCGIIDSINQSLCLPNANECPINKIIINNNEKVSDNYKTYKLNNEKYIHISNNETNSSIIYNITLTDIDYKCENPNENILKYYYELENKIECKKKDNNFKEKIDSVKKKIIYEDNKIYEEIKNLPGYPIHEIEKDDISLLISQIEGYDINIFSNVTTIIKYNKIPSLCIISFLIIWFFIFLIILGYIYFFCGKCIHKENEDDDYYLECPKPDEKGKENCCILFLCILILGACLIHCLIFRKGSNKLKNSTIFFLIIDLIIFILSLVGYVLIIYPKKNLLNNEIINEIFISYQNNTIILKNMLFIFLILVFFSMLFLFLQRYIKAFDPRVSLVNSYNDPIVPPPLDTYNNISPNPNIHNKNNDNPMYNQYNTNTGYI